jgi:hypothetical protein
VRKWKNVLIAPQMIEKVMPRNHERSVSAN